MAVIWATNLDFRQDLGRDYTEEINDARPCVSAILRAY